MKPPPPGWPRITSAVFYRDAAGMIDWLCRAYGFELRLKVEGDGGSIVHSELTLAGGAIMVASEKRDDARRLRTDCVSPLSAAGANTQSLMAYIDDVDAHCATARAAGARIAMEPANQDYGDDYWADRSYCTLDPEGHVWWFVQRLRG